MTMAEFAFWNDFCSRSRELCSKIMAGNGREVVEEIDELLQIHNLPCCFDVTSDSKTCILIFSPERDAEVAAMIDRLVAVAPQVEEWTIFTRRPRKNISDAAAIVRNLYLVDPRNAAFVVHKSKRRHVIKMFVPPHTDLSPEEAVGMINTFLWHALGEDFVMRHEVQGQVVFCDPPFNAISVNELVVLTDSW